MIIEIRHRFSNSVLSSFEANDIKDCLQQAVKRKADLSGAYLIGADLSGAKLRGAKLNWADLSGADLSWSDLRGAELSGATLRYAYLYGAKFYGADLYGEKIAIAPIFICGLIWDICISESYLKIGCQYNLHTEWAKFSDEEIANMDTRALEFWKQNKSWILAACKSHRKESLTFRKIYTKSEVKK